MNCPAHFGNQIASSRSGFGDIVQIERNRRSDSPMLRRDMAKRFDATHRDPDGIRLHVERIVIPRTPTRVTILRFPASL
jgi:hypothetical protein